MRAKLIGKVTSLADLRTRAGQDDRYEQLAIIAAQNLGGKAPDLAAALRWLSLNANETDDESGVVAEVNFCRDLVVSPEPKKGGR